MPTIDAALAILSNIVSQMPNVGDGTAAGMIVASVYAAIRLAERRLGSPADRRDAKQTEVLTEIRDHMKASNSELDDIKRQSQTHNDAVREAVARVADSQQLIAESLMSTQDKIAHITTAVALVDRVVQNELRDTRAELRGAREDDHGRRAGA